LALHILFVTVRTVPFIAVAFDRKPRLSTFDNKVNPIACDFMLGKQGKALAKQLEGDVDLEPTIEWWRRFHDTSIILSRPPLQFVPTKTWR